MSDTQIQVATLVAVEEQVAILVALGEQGPQGPPGTGDGGGGGGDVTSVNGHTGVVVLTAADVGAATLAQARIAALIFG